MVGRDEKSRAVRGDPADDALTREELRAFFTDALARISPLEQDSEEIVQRISDRVARSARAGCNGHGERDVVKPQFDWTWNLPTLFAGLLFASGGIGYVTVQTQRISTLEQNIAAAEQRAAKYIPVIEAAVTRNELQDAQNRVQEERIQNLSVAVQDIRKANTDVMVTLGNIREDLAIIRERLAINRPPQRQTENKR